jgi:hypothetical protein
MAVHEMKLFCVSQALQLLRASLTMSSALNEVFSKSEFLNRESGDEIDSLG